MGGIPVKLGGNPKPKVRWEALELLLRPLLDERWLMPRLIKRQVATVGTVHDHILAFVTRSPLQTRHQRDKACRWYIEFLRRFVISRREFRVCRGTCIRQFLDRVIQKFGLPQQQLIICIRNLKAEPVAI